MKIGIWGHFQNLLIKTSKNFVQKVYHPLLSNTETEALSK